MQEMTTSKYVGIEFQGKMGNLMINSEKVIFRPKLTIASSEKKEESTNKNKNSSNMTSMARSWRWSAIDRLEILDPPRGPGLSPEQRRRSLKLKSKVAEHKAVTLVVPQDILDDLIHDMNKNLSSTALGVEGILPSSVKNTIAPPLTKKFNSNDNTRSHMRRNSTGTPVIKASLTGPSETKTPITSSMKQRRTSMPEIQVTKKVAFQNEPAAAMKLKETTISPTQQQQQQKQTKHQVEEEKGNHPRRSSSVLQKIKTTTQDSVKTTSKLPLRKTSPQQGQGPTAEKKIVTETPLLLLKADAPVVQKTDTDSSSPRVVLASPVKRPLLGFLRPPAPRRNISDELQDMAIKPSPPPFATTSTGTHNNNNHNNNKTKEKIQKKDHKKEAGNEKKQTTDVNTRRSSIQKETTTDKQKKQSTEDAVKVVGPGKNSVFATPPLQSKPKVAAVTKGSTWKPPENLVFTPPANHKEKVLAKNIAFTPPEQTKPKIGQDIVFTPTQQEKVSVPMGRTDKPGDEPSVSTCSSDGDHEPQQQPTSKVQQPNTTQIWNPEAPENAFRMMVLQHAANCPCASGRCEFDPTCSEYKRLLAHVVTCTDQDQCEMEKCFSTKQFLLTVQFLKEFQANQHAKEAKDFLVGVGAVAPLSVIQLPMGSGHSVLSDDNTWWSNDWGAVEVNDNDSD